MRRSTGRIRNKGTLTNEEKGVKNVEEAIAGAKDIIAERISDDANLRKVLREIIAKKAQIKAIWDEETDGNKTYENYKDFSGEVAKIPSHRKKHRHFGNFP